VNVLFRLGCLFPVDQKPIVDAGLWVKGDRIKALGPWEELKNLKASQKIELPDHVMTPGLINCHAHLELTKLRGKIPFKTNFLNWARQIMLQRKDWKKNDFKKSTEEGLRELINGGCSMVVDYSAGGQSFSVLKKSPIRSLCLYEVLQFDPAQIGAEKKKVNKFLKKSQGPRVIRGVAAHAPYTVHPKLITWCLNKNVPSSIHLSELKEELEFLEKDDPENPFLKILRERGRIKGKWQAPALSPAKYLKKLGAKNFSAVHLNYLRPGDIKALKAMKATAIFCPRSHQFFKHSGHPLLKLRKQKIPVGLGTDSCASNRYIDMRAEMKELRKMFKGLKDSEILAMATLEGARALKMDKDIGSLTVGKKADLLFFKLPADPKKSLSRIVSSKPKISAMVCDGKWLKKI
jgi:cytosine/adenosine deaminase-related metal-dependent hydrolase